MKQIVIIIVQTLVISLIVLCSVFQVSCTLTESGIHVLSGDYESPKIISYVVQSNRSVQVTFSESVEPQTARVSDERSSFDVNMVRDDGGTVVIYTLNTPMSVGKKYSLYGEILDEVGNSLTFSLPFTGYNDHCALLALSEIQDGKASSPTKNNLKYEYVEIRVLQSGNLSGLELYSAYDGGELTYQFPAIEVKKGEVIMLHMRTDEEGNCIDELDTDFTLASGYACFDTARDLWFVNDKPCFGSSGDIIVIKHTYNDTIMDAFMYLRFDRQAWAKESVTQYAQVVTNGIWNGVPFSVEKKSSPYNFVRKHIQVQDEQITVEKSDWDLVTPSKASPGI